MDRQNLQIKEFLEAGFSTYLETLKSWVEINSFTANPDGVNAVGRKTAAAFDNLGFAAEFIQSENHDFGKHLVLTREGSSGDKIGLITHLDTVFPPEEEAANDFYWRPAGDWIYGPGTEDIKGGTLTILMLLDALNEFAPQDFEKITWIILANASEETLADDFGVLCRERLGDRGIAALVFEAGFHDDGVFSLVTSRKGMANYRIAVEGKSSHAGSKHAAGANAIAQLADIVTQITALTDYEKNLTFNIGTIEGGVVTNRVPHFAEARGEMRTFDQDVYDQAIQDLLSLANQEPHASEDGYPCKIDINTYHMKSPWPKNTATDRLLALWQSVAQDLGYQVLPEARGGLSDGNNTWETLPTIDGLGPNGGNGHCSERSPDGSKDQEYIDITSLIPKTILNFTAIRKLIATN